MTTKLIKWLTVLSLFISVPVAVVAQAEEKPPSPGPDYVWEEAYLEEDGNVVAPGFWRLQTHEGFEWVAGRTDAEGRYIPGHWHSLELKPDKMWIPGYWAHNQWIAGRWRVKVRTGFRWIPGHWTRQGIWVGGHWHPVKALTGQVWVPGHWSRRGTWVPGHWRPVRKRGLVWLPGHFNRHGIWIGGRWVKTRRGQVWVPGHFNRQGGHWRPIHRRGHIWIRGHYNRFGVWVPGHWRRGRR